MSAGHSKYEIIKYKNRKLYDPHISKYVNYIEIRSILKRGIPIKVIEYETGKDITKITLKKIEESSNLNDIDPLELLIHSERK